MCKHTLNKKKLSISSDKEIKERERELELGYNIHFKRFRKFSAKEKKINKKIRYSVVKHSLWFLILNDVIYIELINCSLTFQVLY